GAAPRAHDPRPAQLGEDVLEEVLGYRLPPGELLALHRGALSLGRSELRGGAHRVVRFGRDPHAHESRGLTPHRAYSIFSIDIIRFIDNPSGGLVHSS